MADVSALLAAARGGDAERVSKLAGEVNPSSTERETTALFEAVSVSDAAVVDALLACDGLDPNVSASKFHATPLAYAAEAGDTAMVEALLSHPLIDVNAGADGLGTPFALACLNGRREVVAVLLEREDVDVNRHSRNGIPPLTEAIKLGHKDVVTQLLASERVNVTHTIDGGDNLTPFAFACETNNLDTVKQLLDSGRFDVKAEVESFDLMGKASERGHSELFETLEEYFLVRSSFEELDEGMQSRKLWYVFKKYDTDETGYLQMTHLGPLAAELGTELSDGELREACVALDTNKNGTIEFNELVAFWCGEEA